MRGPGWRGRGRRSRGEPKSATFAAVVEQDVSGHVAVHEAGPVRGLERLQHGVEDREGLLGRQPAALAQDVADGAARDVLHDQVDDAVVLALVVDGDDVGVGEAGGGLGLAHEAGD
jgi:hypothetical protein